MGNYYRWIAWAFVLIVIVTAVLLVTVYLIPARVGPPEAFQVSPAEITLCLAQARQFRAVHEGRSVDGMVWQATDGAIGPEGFFVAPQAPGDHQVSACHPRTGRCVGAVVHVIQCTTETTPDSTPASTPLPPTETQAPAPPPPTQTPPPPTPVPAPTSPAQPPTPTPTSAALRDESNDLVNSNTLEPAIETPLGSDIETACFDGGLHIVREMEENLSAEIGDWDAAGNLILWMKLYEPIPEVSEQRRYWIFALDTDNNAATGRPVGDGVINPDIGVEITIGVQSDPARGIAFEPYMYIWNAQLNDSERRTSDLETRLSSKRDVIFIRVPEDLIAELVRGYSQTEPQWNAIAGRAAALVETSEEIAVDFLPELP